MSYALLIDDDAGLRDSLSRIALVDDLELLTASTWEEGLAMFQVYSPTLVIADYQLPNSEHGMQLLAAIRRLSPSVRLILLSAYINEEDVADIEALGLVDRAIPKTRPDVPADLLQEIRAARERAATPTDWAAYATAHRHAQAVEKHELDELDERLRRARGIG